jgi:UDP-N-acetylglucosamine 2-epimerase (non-hydrolysing)
MDGITLIPPLGYLDFVGLMSEAHVVLTDSGGIQEETTMLGVPCLTLRESTERPITVSHGTNQVVGTDIDTVRTAFEQLRQGQTTITAPPLWDGKAAERIVSFLERTFANR